ncbi:MAG: pantoate--beta-alanine ligase [Phycisphaeraceae bacterium]|nr:pantoate--beta-alanine ligase [Phycisphaeraceae bacterium]
MWIAKDVASLREYRAKAHGRVALVPTMGALHDGHVSLIKRAHEIGHTVIVSLFVNPTQFAPHEDLEKYPRPFEADVKKCLDAGVDGLFAPTVDAMYPPEVVGCDVNVPELAQVLEGASRPTHFAGVCRVVAKLFNMVKPHAACFGMKDYQQLTILRAMVEDLAFDIQIEACPTIREDDGLAMSSRNVYLEGDQRQHALGLSKALKEAVQMVHTGESDPAIIQQVMKQVMQAHHVAVDYAVIRHAHTLRELDNIDISLSGSIVALVAGKVGNVRLIDNMVIKATP